MSRDIGRNDPCYCGSGKKYKKCHLPLDEQNACNPAALEQEQTPSAPPRPKLGAWRARANRPQSNAAKDLLRNRDWSKFWEECADELNLVPHQDEIRGALEIAGKHMEELVNLARDAEAFDNHSIALYEQELFAPMRFTADQVANAAAELGLQRSDLIRFESLAKLACHLLPPAKRNEFTRSLLLLVPELVADERYTDALLVALAAASNIETPDKPSPFLAKMVIFGLEEWDERDSHRKLEILKDLGIEVTPDLEAGKATDLIRERLSDPAVLARLEEFANTNPDLFRDSFDELRRRSTNLLNRDDCRAIELTEDEINHCKRVLSEQRAKRQPDPLLEHESSDPENRRKLFDEFWMPLLKELVIQIFTPQRRTQMAEDLRDYAEELEKSGERDAARDAKATAEYVGGEDQPELNPFLMHVCARFVLCADAEN